MDHFDRHTANGPLSLESVGSHHNSDNTNQREIIMSDGSDSHSATPIKSEPDEHVRKVHRLGRACDPCSIRKTKVSTDWKEMTSDLVGEVFDLLKHRLTICKV